MTLKAHAVQPLDPARQQRSVIAQRQLRRCRGRHGIVAEERNPDAVIHLLIDQHRHGAFCLHRRDQPARTSGTFRDRLDPEFGPKRRHLGLDHRIVGGAIDLRHVKPAITGGDAADLPIAEMPGKDHAGLAARGRFPGRDRGPIISTRACSLPWRSLARWAYSAITRPRLSHHLGDDLSVFGPRAPAWHVPDSGEPGARH